MLLGLYVGKGLDILDILRKKLFANMLIFSRECNYLNFHFFSEVSSVLFQLHMPLSFIGLHALNGNKDFCRASTHLVLSLCTAKC